ncbi:MAG: hypothetical protein ACWGQW_18085 [bacterium]
MFKYATSVEQVLNPTSEAIDATPVYPDGLYCALSMSSSSVPAHAIHIHSVLTAASNEGGFGCQVNPVAAVPTGICETAVNPWLSILTETTA